MFFLDTFPDTRLQHLPFNSIESVIIIITLYLLFVLKWGPKFMENRRPFNIDRILLCYNGIQVVANFSIIAYVSIFEMSVFPSETFIHTFIEANNFIECVHYQLTGNYFRSLGAG